MYCWDQVWSVPPSLTRTVAQGIDPANSTCEWVPCGFVHHGGSALPLAERIRRIGAYWWWTLPLVRHGRQLTPSRLRAPWVLPPLQMSEPAPGPIEQAWAELDTQKQDPELEWL
jgi:hypothetical protein